MNVPLPPDHDPEIDDQLSEAPLTQDEWRELADYLNAEVDAELAKGHRPIAESCPALANCEF